MTRADRVFTPPLDTPAITSDTRRGFLVQAAAAAGGAALGAVLPLPEPAIASERVPDPVFALIASHRRAYAAWSAAVDTESMLEEELSKDSRHTHLTAWNDAIVETDDPRWIASEKHYRKTWDQQVALAWEIAAVPATTLAGVAALAAYVSECEERRDLDVWPQPTDGRDKGHIVFHRNLASALADLVDGRRA